MDNNPIALSIDTKTWILPSHCNDTEKKECQSLFAHVQELRPKPYNDEIALAHLCSSFLFILLASLINCAND